MVSSASGAPGRSFRWAASMNASRRDGSRCSTTWAANSPPSAVVELLQMRQRIALDDVQAATAPPCRG